LRDLALNDKAGSSKMDIDIKIVFANAGETIVVLIAE
jgi:hypothetical protein